MQFLLFNSQNLASKASALIAAYLLLQVIRFIINRRQKHKTFERMKIPHLKPKSLIQGSIQELLRKNPVNFFEKIHKKCGKTGGYYIGGDPIIATSDPNLIQEVFVEKAHIFHDRGPSRIEVEPLPHSIFILKGKRWHYLRKLLSPAFAQNKIKSDQFYRDTQQTIEEFISQLERNSEWIEDKKLVTFVEGLYDRMAACATDVIVKSVFCLDGSVSFQGPLRGVKKKPASELAGWGEWLLGALGKRTELKGDGFLDALQRSIRALVNPAVAFIHCFPAFEKPLTFVCNHLYLGPLIDLFFNQISTLTQQTSNDKERGVGSQRRRIIDTLLDGFREEKITLNEVKGNAISMVLAGFETTANALTFTLWLLAKNERVQVKLRSELEARLPRDKKGTVKSTKELTQAELGELVASCEYLESAINESLRLYPPGPYITVRQANADCVLSDGLRVERGVAFVASVYKMHRDETFWGRDAHLFKPERFEMLDSNQLKSNMFMPFGIGQRICIGRTLAQHELKIMLGRLLLDYFIVPWEGKTPEVLKLSLPSVVTITCIDKVGIKFVKM